MSDKMNAEWKAKWVAALNSGDYTQGYCRLSNDDNTFCCLGVLCDIVQKEYPDKLVWETNPNETYRRIKDVNNDVDAGHLPPLVVMDIVGLPTENPDVLINGRMHSMGHHNDHGGASFTQLAAAIEEQL